MVSYKLTTFYDPMGDGKSDRKKFSSKIIHSELSKDEISEKYKDSLNDYYGGVSIVFGNWKQRK